MTQGSDSSLFVGFYGWLSNGWFGFVPQNQSLRGFLESRPSETTDVLYVSSLQKYVVKSFPPAQILNFHGF
jgi:hypothetical protein